MVTAGVASIALRVPAFLDWSERDVESFLGLAVVLAVLELFPLPIRHRTEILYLSLTDGLWAAALLLTSPSVLTLAVGAGALLGQAARRRAPVKIAYNVGQFLFAITVAEAVFAALGPPASVGAHSGLVAGVAMAACFVVNATLTAFVISLVEGEPLWRVMVPPLGPNVMHWAGNVAMGVLGAVMWARARFALPLLVVPIVLSYFAYRAWLQGMRERDRMRALYHAGQALSGPVDAPADFKPFLWRVREMLDAEAVEIVVMDGEQVVVHGAESTTALNPDGGPRGETTQAYVRARPGLALHLAPLGGFEEVRGALAVYRDTALTSSERSLVDTLASQVAVRLENRRLFEETLEQQTQLAEIIAHSSDGIFVVTPDRRVLSWNPAMEAITGFSSREVMGRTWEEVFGSQAGAGDRDVIGDGSGEVRDVLFASKDGTPRWIRYSRTPIRDGAGSKGDVVVARDVTAELEAEQLKADFVATVSHELRTPLTPLKGFLSTLLSGAGEDTAQSRREYYRIMMKQVTRLERLITDLLEVSRIESGKVPVQAQPVNLGALVGEQVKEFSSQHPDWNVLVEVPAGDVMVRADPFRVGQVVANLVSNAIKYSPVGSPVDVKVATAGNQAIVSVRDEGEGIPASEQERVFDRFHRVDGGLTSRTGGTGLGLYIAKRLVEAMSGRLWLVSRPGDGSTFSFSLPLARLGGAEGSGEERAASSSPTHSGSPPISR